MGYALPSNTDYVSCSWQCHKDRNPPSTEPGTDYGAAYGSPLYAVGTGTVVDLKTSNSNATGRYLTIDLDDGRRARSLHLSEIWVGVGQRVTQGQQIGKTGASGYGSDWGYGAHVHETLWSSWSYSFCSTCTIDFALYVGTPAPAPTQRVTGPNGANQRPEPNTSSPVSNFIAPNVVADFDGWINGEAVEGNPVWFHGAHSGLWSWSGGFTDTGTHDLADLNPVTPPAGNSRTAVADGANVRSAPSTGAGSTGFVNPGATVTMDGWITGDAVEGNSTWFHLADGTGYAWSGGFTDHGTHDLTDLNPTPEPGADRTVGSNPANIRDLPYTSSPVVGSSTAGALVRMRGWTHAEAVQGNDVWYQRDTDSDWSWSGGFTSTATDGLTQLPTPNPPTPPNPDNPRGLPEYEPVYPQAVIGLAAPMGFTDCQNPTTRALRTTAGGLPVTPVIDTYIVHHTATTSDQLEYFSYCNDRSVCPSYYLRTDGTMYELIRPQAKPAATGPDWNWRSIATETQDADASWTITDAQLEAHAQIIAWMATFDGKTLDGVPVEFTIDRTHVISHREALPGSTECPGEYLQSRMDAIVARAQQIYDGENPGGGPLDPNEYPALFELHEELWRAFEEE